MPKKVTNIKKRSLTYIIHVVFNKQNRHFQLQHNLHILHNLVLISVTHGTINY